MLFMIIWKYHSKNIWQYILVQMSLSIGYLPPHITQWFCPLQPFWDEAVSLSESLSKSAEMKFLPGFHGLPHQHQMELQAIHQKPHLSWLHHLMLQKVQVLSVFQLHLQYQPKLRKVNHDIVQQVIKRENLKRYVHKK